LHIERTKGQDSNNLAVRVWTDFTEQIPEHGQGNVEKTVWLISKKLSSGHKSRANPHLHGDAGKMLFTRHTSGYYFAPSRTR